MKPLGIVGRGGRVVVVVCLLAFSAAWCSEAQAVTQTSAYLPPGNGEYVNFVDDANFSNGVIMSNPRHGVFFNTVRTQIGADEQQVFDSELAVDVTSPQYNGPMTLTGPVTVMVRNYTGGQTGPLFVTEIVSMSLTTAAMPGLIVRESVTLGSTGETTITDLSGGMYDIDSFFDVFTELSLDYGTTWAADTTGPLTMTLVPEPATLSLLVLGALAVTRRRRTC